MTGPDALTFQRFDTQAARDASALIEDLYVRSHEDAIASGDPFRTTATFMNRFDRYTNTAADRATTHHGVETEPGVFAFPRASTPTLPATPGRVIAYAGGVWK